MRLMSALSRVALWGCTTQDVEVLSNAARFPAYPDALFSAIESTCTDPADTLLRPKRGILECRSFLSPEESAALIITYDGTPEKLPQLVMRFQALKDNGGYLVDYQAFIDVPQKTGAPVRLSQHSPWVLRRMAQIFQLSGGEMVPPPAEA